MRLEARVAMGSETAAGRGLLVGCLHLCCFFCCCCFCSCCAASTTPSAAMRCLFCAILAARRASYSLTACRLGSIIACGMDCSRSQQREVSSGWKVLKCMS